MEESRIKKSLRNSVTGIVGMLLMLFVSFFSKSVFIKVLGDAFNGVNYLFYGILNALNLAEMGFASAIAFALYKPLSIGDEDTAAALMNFFRKVYRIVAIIVAVLGSLCIPFLPYLIKEDIETLPFTLQEIRSYYVIFLLNTVLSYLLAYKRTIITADQQEYIVTSVDYSCNIVLNILQVILLITTRNYYAYLIIMLAKTVINNIIISIIANKKYPYLVTGRNIKLLSEEKSKLFKNVRAMMLHNIGGVVIINSVTIVVSAIVGLRENSLYGNYLMIASQVMNFLNIVFNSVTASVGNLCAKESKEKQIEIFERMNYLSMWIGFFVFVCLVCLYNPFMVLWIGEGSTFSMLIVVMIATNQCVNFVRRSVNTFKSAKGLFLYDRYKPLIEAAVGITLAIVLGKMWGIFGILFGYTFATVFVAMPVEKWALFRKGFNMSSRKYIFIDLLTVLLTGVVTFLMFSLTSLLGGGILNFIIRLFMCLIIPNGIFILLTFRTKEFKYYVGLIKNIFIKKSL